MKTEMPRYSITSKTIITPKLTFTGVALMLVFTFIEGWADESQGIGKTLPSGPGKGHWRNFSVLDGLSSQEISSMANRFVKSVRPMYIEVYIDRVRVAARHQNHFQEVHGSLHVEINGNESKPKIKESDV